MVVTQIRTAAELRAHYAGIRRRLTSAATPRPTPPPAAPPPTASDAAPIPTPKPKPAPPAPGKPLDLPVASAINKLPIRSIQIEVAKAFGMTVGIMLSPLRTMPFVVPRQLAMALCRLQGYPSSMIGRAFGRDRTTIIHAFNRFAGDALPIGIDPVAEPFVWITAARNHLIATGQARCLNLDDLSG